MPSRWRVVGVSGSGDRIRVAAFRRRYVYDTCGEEVKPKTFTPQINAGLPPMPEVTPEMQSEWTEWTAMRPESVKALARKFPPWHYYEMPKTKQIVTVESYFENGTLRVTVVGDRISIPAVVRFGVFGVHPNDLICVDA